MFDYNHQEAGRNKRITRDSMMKQICRQVSSDVQKNSQRLSAQVVLLLGSTRAMATAACGRVTLNKSNAHWTTVSSDSETVPTKRSRHAASS
jgi:hypothetical protein